MKKLMILLISILFSFGTFAQRISLNKAVSIYIPKSLHEINREQAVAHTDKKFKGDKMLLNFDDMDTDSGHLYQVNNIIIALKSFDTTFNFEAEHAAHLKKVLDGLARKRTYYTSNLKTVNNNTIVITNYIIGDTGYCFFFCFNANNTRTISGRLVYDKADKDNVTPVLNDIINGIKFKD